MPNRRDVQVNVRFLADEVARVQANADAANLSLSAYIRERSLQDPGEMARLKARVEKLEEMAEQYDNLEALLADPRWIPRPG